MRDVILNAMRAQPFVCVIVCLYVGSIVWNLSNRDWGPALYWTSAAMISVTATWLMGWRG